MTWLRAARFALVLFVLPFRVYGDEKAVVEQERSERRRHFEITAADGAKLYEGTEIVRMGELVEEKIVLVRDEGHGDFLVRWVWDYQTQTVHHRIADVKDRVFLQLSSQSPFTSRTRSETMAEAKSNPRLATINAVLRLETNGGVWEGSEAEWNEQPASLRSLRHSLRMTLDRFILETIERGRGVLFSTAEGEGFFLLVGRYAVYDTEYDNEHVGKADHILESHTAAPSCEFDEVFGFPCSEKQKERIRKAARNTVIPETY